MALELDELNERVVAFDAEIKELVHRAPDMKRLTEISAMCFGLRLYAFAEGFTVGRRRRSARAKGLGRRFGLCFRIAVLLIFESGGVSPFAGSYQLGAPRAINAGGEANAPLP